MPYAYYNIGHFVKPFEKTGDIIYAEKLRNKKGEVVYKDREVLYFHSAIYLGKMNKTILSLLPFSSDIKDGTPVIWHSSFIAGGTQTNFSKKNIVV